MVTGLLAAIMGNIGFGAGHEYQAIFTSASMLEKGDDVRVAGVSVGEVKKVEHYERNHALVTFRVKADVPLTTASRAEVRFLNLVGDRYLALEEGDDANAEPLEEDEPLPIDQTSPALDLTTLFNGFKPLFQALKPEDVNELTLNLVQVLQGEGGTVQGLLQKTASLTTTLADRDELIGDVIDNLSTTLQTVDSRSEQLTSLVTELKDWMQDLARDRKTIGSSLSSISDLTVVVADLLHDGRPLIKSDVAELRRAVGAADDEAVAQAGRRAARPAARVDDRPDPHRHLRLLVQLLRLRLLGRDQPAQDHGDPARLAHQPQPAARSRSTSAARRRGATHDALERGSPSSGLG